MSHLSREPAQDDTHLQPVLFPDGTDRRTSARVPLGQPVKIGPPNGLPTSVVSAGDLSLGGLFVDADREVRVGARFSVEVPLSNGERIYVPEAEVAYNRQRSASSGFGVRFLEIDREALEAIAGAIESATGYVTEISARHEVTAPVRRTTRPQLSGLPTIVPAGPPTLAVQISQYPEPSIIEEALLLDEPFDDEPDHRETQVGAVGAAWLRAKDAVHDLRLDLAERARRTPKLFKGIAVVGAASLAVAFAVTLVSGGDSEAIASTKTIAPTVPPATYNVLMGKAANDALDAPEPMKDVVSQKSVAKKRTLPPLVPLEAPRTKTKPIEAKPIQVAIAPVKAPAVDSKVKAKTPSARAQSILGTSTDRVSIELDSGARVLKTHVLRSPDRYVLDLVGQSCPLGSVSVSGAVRRIRSARHPDYCRVVVDTTKHLEAGRWSKKNKTLVVELHY